MFTSVLQISILTCGVGGVQSELRGPGKPWHSWQSVGAVDVLINATRKAVSGGDLSWQFVVCHFQWLKLFSCYLEMPADINGTVFVETSAD